MKLRGRAMAAAMAALLTCGSTARSEPVVVADGLERPGALAVDSTLVYWTERGSAVDGTLRAAPRGGGAPVTLAAEHGGPWDISVSGEHVYWTAADRVMRLARADIDLIMTGRGTPSPSVVVSGVLGTGLLAVRDGEVFFTTSGEPGTLQRVSVDGGTTVIVAQDLQSPRDVVVSDTHVYWTSELPRGLLVGRPTHGTVTRMALSGGAPEVVIEGQYGLGQLATDGRAVYWTSDSGGGAVWRVLDAGGPPVAIVTGHPQPKGVAVDRDHVYWTDRGDGTVWRASKSGGSPEQIAGGQQNVGRIVIDAGSLFWINQADLPPLFGRGPFGPRLRPGAVMRLDVGAGGE